jgi:hypothetical protein
MMIAYLNVFFFKDYSSLDCSDTALRAHSSAQVFAVTEDMLAIALICCRKGTKEILDESGNATSVGILLFVK